VRRHGRVERVYIGKEPVFEIFDFKEFLMLEPRSSWPKLQPSNHNPEDSSCSASEDLWSSQYFLGLKNHIKIYKFLACLRAYTRDSSRDFARTLCVGLLTDFSMQIIVSGKLFRGFMWCFYHWSLRFFRFFRSHMAFSASSTWILLFFKN